MSLQQGEIAMADDEKKVEEVGSKPSRSSASAEASSSARRGAETASGSRSGAENASSARATVKAAETRTSPQAGPVEHESPANPQSTFSASRELSSSRGASRGNTRGDPGGDGPVTPLSSFGNAWLGAASRWLDADSGKGRPGENTMPQGENTMPQSERGMTSPMPPGSDSRPEGVGDQRDAAGADPTPKPTETDPGVKAELERSKPMEEVMDEAFRHRVVTIGIKHGMGVDKDGRPMPEIDMGTGKPRIDPKTGKPVEGWSDPMLEYFTKERLEELGKKGYSMGLEMTPEQMKAITAELDKNPDADIEKLLPEYYQGNPQYTELIRRAHGAGVTMYGIDKEEPKELTDRRKAWDKAQDEEARGEKALPKVIPPQVADALESWKKEHPGQEPSKDLTLKVGDQTFAYDQIQEAVWLTEKEKQHQAERSREMTARTQEALEEAQKKNPQGGTIVLAGMQHFIGGLRPDDNLAKAMKERGHDVFSIARPEMMEGLAPEERKGLRPGEGIFKKDAPALGRVPVWGPPNPAYPREKDYTFDDIFDAIIDPGW